MASDLKFIPNRPVDAIDVPFRIQGHQLRWVNGKKFEQKYGRPWKVLRKQDLPKEQVQSLERQIYGIFQDDTIRNGDLVLAFAPLDAVNEVRAANKRAADDMLQSIKRSGNNPAIQVDKKETQITREGPQAFEK